MTPYAAQVAMSIMDSLALALSGILFVFSGIILMVRSSSKVVQALRSVIVVAGFIVALVGIFLTLSPHVPPRATIIPGR